MRRPSNGIIKRVFRFLGVYIVIVFITTFIFSLMQPIISLVGFSILDLLVEIIYSLTGIDMSFLLAIAVFLGCAFIDVKYIQYKRKKKEEQFDEMDERIKILNSEYSEIEKERQKFISENMHTINWIPQDYRKLDALAFIKKMLVCGRADTWKEAVNLYHEEKSREADRKQQMLMHMFSEINASMRNREIKKSLDEQKNILNDINKKMWRYL